MDDHSRVKMVERVCVQKFDHSGDEPVVVDTVVQETVAEVSQTDAMLMGWVPKDQDTSVAPTAIGSSDVAESSVSD